ncbi:DUF2237 domain-containing protein [Methylotenera oryzisoli]|jgi:hypothetical protein|uniref:DUF2237 domain-containing protein n=1 Tax=Methylotenera oryzisoli TaxID=2080758 RepID=A0A4Y9VQD5_9PROT|nr:DUF2237 domain-containing protein [Methylotenera oryzisoli]TFW70956.1 DUF2237 domain-containing protein [Methylotenera oryzisoli]
MTKPQQKNVLGTALQTCSLDPVTGFTRSGCCETGTEDHGSHTVCAQMTEEFLAFSISRGNDLSTARPEYGFEGLSAGDRWCLCASRWLEASEAGFAPPVILESCHEKCLEIVSLADLKYHALR